MTDTGECEDLQQFMEVVTAYRCKLCNFTATSTQEMRQHMKSDHIVADKKSSDGQVSVSQPVSQPENILKTAVQSVPLIGDITPVGSSYESSSSATVLQPDNPLSSVNSHVVTYKIPEGSYSFVSSGSMPGQSPSPGSGNVIITLNNGQSVLKPNSENTHGKTVNQDGSGEGSSLTTLRFVTRNEEDQYILEDPDTLQLSTELVQDSGVEPVGAGKGGTTGVGESGAMGTYTAEQSNDCLLQNQGNTVTESEMRHNGDQVYQELHIKEAQPEDMEVITKDVYLCGNCSESFASIQECKDHMTNVHEVTDFQTSCRVDASTQMEPKKRAGRKKKSEKVEEKPKEVPAELEVSESDEEWTEQLFTCPTRSRRKRKPPAALRNDYLVGRIKRKEQTSPREPRPVHGIKCPFPGCTVRFGDEETMKEHASYHVEKDSAHTFKCNQCEEIAFSWKQMRHHLWKFHRVGIDLLSCQICNNFKTDVPSKLKIHMEVHGEDRPYHCKQCDKTFKQFAQLKNHEICHLPDEVTKSSEVADKWYSPKQCDICGRTFVNTKCMRKHREDVHGSNKPFKCSQCSYAASRKAMLVLHLRTHSGVKPFKCDVCNYSCGDHNSLRRHKMRHTGQKPYSCPHCPYTSIQAISLKVHVKNKHPGMGGVFYCPLCMYGTVNKTHFDNHIMDHKNGLIKATASKEVSLTSKVTKTTSNKQILQTSKPQQVLVGSEVATLFLPSAGNQNLFITAPISVAQAGNMHTLIEAASVDSTLQPSVILIDGKPVRFQLQTNESGESVLVEEVASVNNRENLGSQDEAAAQLIYSALNAISETADTGSENIDSQNLVAGVESGEIQTSIETHLKEGVTTHTITFHLPEGEELTREVTLVSESNVKTESVESDNMSGDMNEWQGNVA